jgi:hypothetical protein
VDAALAPFIDRFLELVDPSARAAGRPPALDPPAGAAGAADEAPHVAAERLALQKLYFLFVQHVATYGCARALVSAANGARLEFVLGTCLHGLQRIGDVSLKRSCLLIFVELVKRWGAGGGDACAADAAAVDPALAGSFLRFVVDAVLPAAFGAVLSDAFDSKDAMAMRVPAEVGHLLFALRAHALAAGAPSPLSPALVASVAAQLPGGAPPALANELASAFAAAATADDMRRGLCCFTTAAHAHAAATRRAGGV